MRHNKWKYTSVILLTLLSLCFFTRKISAEPNIRLLQPMLANYTCVFLKFTNRTKFKEITAESTFADLVIHKFLTGRYFAVRETKPIENEIAAMLYDDTVRAEYFAKKARENNDLDIIFDSALFNEEKAKTISDARQGQVFAPDITAEIGKDHKVDYIVHGTVSRISTFNKRENKGFNILFGDGASPFGWDNNTVGMRVTCELRIIKANTGEIVWMRRIDGIDTTTETSWGGLSFGNDKLNSNLYGNAIENAATQIVEALEDDIKENRVILE